MAATWRVRDRETFLELRRNGRRVRNGPISVTWLPGPVGTPPRLACSIGRHVGSAVVRNRVRRRIRSIMAGAASDLPPGAYLVGAGPAAAGLTYGDLRSIVLTAIAALPDPGPPADGSA